LKTISLGSAEVENDTTGHPALLEPVVSPAAAEVRYRLRPCHHPAASQKETDFAPHE
jgi:hypothetical protein